MILKVLEHILSYRHNKILEPTQSWLQKGFTQGCSSLNTAVILTDRIQKEEPLNQHETPGRQIKQSNQLSFPHQDGDFFFTVLHFNYHSFSVNVKTLFRTNEKVKTKQKNIPLNLCDRYITISLHLLSSIQRPSQLFRSAMKL